MDRAPAPDPDEGPILGRGENDHAMLFPKYSLAAASSTGEAVVNGKVINIWEYGQLENLSVPVLQQRALVLRDALGQEKCPQMPSKQRADLIRWILHVQSDITKSSLQSGRAGPGVPKSMIAENKERPISPGRPAPQRSSAAPFGPRQVEADFKAARDNYGAMLQQPGEYVSDERRVGNNRKVAVAEKLRSNGMKSVVADGADPYAQQAGEGRRYLGCKDSYGEQLKESERGGPALATYRRGIESIRGDAGGMRAVFASDAAPQNGVSPVIGEEGPDNRWLGDRKKRVEVQGEIRQAVEAAPPPEVAGTPSRKPTFGGPDASFKGEDPQYKRTWRQDPSRLMGSSLLV
mmetsp:Transcript_61941/g.114975  ORF Transcript_61941/g.114975 Transcript_61941/m.114975 type:complete len:348 (+) Transcript_61941:57-1100(+)